MPNYNSCIYIYICTIGGGSETLNLNFYPNKKKTGILIKNIGPMLGNLTEVTTLSGSSTCICNALGRSSGNEISINSANVTFLA